MATTTLNGAIDDTVTDFDVVSTAGFPSPNFRVLVDSEIMLVTGVTGTTFTATRGDMGTTAASHSNGADVTYGVSGETGGSGVTTY